MDYTLKFPDQATAEEVLSAMTEQSAHAIDTIGVIYKPTGEAIENDGMTVNAVAPIDGWHVNVRGPEDTSLDPYVVEVTSPVRVWA